MPEPNEITLACLSGGPNSLRLSYSIESISTSAWLVGEFGNGIGALVKRFSRSAGPGRSHGSSKCD